MTYTVAQLEVSAETYDEIRALLVHAEYTQAIVNFNSRRIFGCQPVFGDEMIDMQGLALTRGESKTVVTLPAAHRGA